VGAGRLISVRLTPFRAFYARVSQRAGLQFNEIGCYVAFFDDMMVALEAYPETYVTLEILGVDDVGDVLDVEDEGTFEVKLTNNGPLNLTGVTVRIDGKNGAKVKDNNILAEFKSDFVWNNQGRELPTINGDGGELVVPMSVGPFGFKAPAEPSQDEKVLVKATLQAWDGDLSRIMINHSNPHRDVPAGTYSAKVHRD
jgi:hypothetical protein